MNKSFEEASCYHPPAYFPLRRTGSCLFNKKPDQIPDDVIELIGKRGVRDIHKKLAELVEENKKHFGDAFIRFFGLFYYQEFLDVQNRVIIKVFQMIDNEDKKDKVPYIMKKGRPIFDNDNLSNKAVIRKIKSGSFSIANDDQILQYLPRGKENI